jgi:glutaredoxin
MHHISAFSNPSPSSASPIYSTIQSSTSLLDPITGKPITSPILRNDNKRKSLVVLLPQLGEFDSSEYTEFLTAASPTLEENNIDLQVIGIGDTIAARNFCEFTKLPTEKLCIDPEATLYKELDLYAGPNFSLPDGIAENEGLLQFFLSQLPGGVPKEGSQLVPVANAWFNYLLMCAGIGAPGTLREILRGYFGDKKAPERFRDDDVVKAGFITIGPGVGPVTMGPLSYNQWFADEKGYQRPVELATIRLKNMVEVLTKWDQYVSNPLVITQRGATFLFDEEGNELYSYKTPGVLTYSDTMARPLTFLSPYIGESVSRNPLGLLDNGGGNLTRGRGILKPAGKAMGLLSFCFKLENKLQAQLFGADDADYTKAKKEIEDTISSNGVVVYTYGLSPFSAETLGVLDEIGADYENVEVGLEWFLLDKEKSALRAQLLEMTGQSSLPHVFINGEHVGGLFTGSSDGSYPGLAGLKESGELQKMIGSSTPSSTSFSLADPAV